MSIREECITNLVASGDLTPEEADTLFTVDELCQAYHACARELIETAIKDSESFEIGTRSSDNIDPEACNSGNMASYNFALASFLLARAQTLNQSPLSEDGADFYSQNVRALLDLRLGGKPPPILGKGDARSELCRFDKDFRYEDVLKYLPERTRTPFERPQEFGRRFDLAHFHLRGGTA